MKVLISADELYPLIDKGRKNLLVVDTRPFAEYVVGHVPGSVNIDLMQFHWIDTSRQGIREFRRQTKALLSNIGVSRDKFVVFYDDVSGPSAARGVWLLLYFSHKNVAMLDGGIEAWKKKYATEVKTNAFSYAKFDGRPNPRLLADYKKIRSVMKNKNTVIVDSRSLEEYDGKVARAAHAGHIPGAVNIDWNHNISGSKFKGLDELAKIYAEVPKDAEVITYCQGGYRAANSFVVLKMLGYKNVKMYLGSWGEWGNKSHLPVSK